MALAVTIVAVTLTAIIIDGKIIKKKQSVDALTLNYAENSKGEVLAASTENQPGLFTVNIPSLFTDNLSAKKDFTTEGTTTLKGDVFIQGKKVDLGSSILTAPNVVYSLKASGDGIKVSGNQDITVSNTGVTSFQGSTGSITLTAGTGITLDGLTISSSVTNPNTFKTVTIGSDSFSAGSATDTLTFAAGSGVTLSTDTTNKKITIAGTSSSTGWSLTNSKVNLSDSTYSVGIGTSDPTAKLDVNGAASISGQLALYGTPTIQSTANQVLTLGGNTTGNIVFSPLNGSGTITFSNLTTNGGILYTNGSGILAQTGLGGTSQCLLGGTSPSWGSCNGSITNGTGFDLLWTQTSGLLTPNNSTLDFVLGSQASSSAKFAVLNLNSGTPTASVSATTGTGLTLGGDGTIQALRNGTLTLGGSTTGNIVFSPLNGSGTVKLTNFSTNGGLVYANGSGVLAQTGAGNSSQCLTGGTTPTWGTCGTNNWQEVLGAVSPANITDDLLIGASASSSAVFQVSGTTGALTMGGSSNSISTATAGKWTLGANTFTYRRTITVTNNDGSTALPVNYQVTLSLSGSTASDICSNSRTDNNDIRVATSNPTETARNITRTCNTSVSISFQLQSQIAASGTGTYYLYYGNSSLASSGSTYNYNNVQLDSADNVANWTSSDNTNYALSQETTIKQEGTGSVKAISIAATGGAVGSWTTQANTPNQVIDDGRFLVVNVGGTNYAYDIGGNNNSGSFYGYVYKSTIDSSGNLGTWAATNSLSVCNDKFAVTTTSIGGTNYIYVLGGHGLSGGGVACSSGNNTYYTTVYKGTVASDGTVTWTTGSQNALTNATQGLSAVIVNVGGTNYLYAIGGDAGAGAQTWVYRATLDSSGNVGAWTTTGQTQLTVGLTNGRAVTATVNSTNYIYTVGGTAASGTPTVFKGTVDSSGNITAWDSASQSQINSGTRIGLSSSIFQNSGSTYIYAVGGGNGNYTSLGTVAKATVDSSGNVGTWSTVGNGTLNTARESHDGAIATVGTTYYIYAAMGKNGPGFCCSYTNTISIERATITTVPARTATRTISSTDLSSYNAITFKVYSTVSGSYMNFHIGQSAASEFTSAFTINSPNTWETKTIDISSLGARSAITILQFEVSNTTTGFTLYFDDIQATPSTFAGTTPTTSSGSKVLGASALTINSQGSSGILLNYDPTNSLGGTGGITVYNGSSTALFSIDSSGNASQSGGLTFSAGNSIQTTSNQTFTVGGNTTGDISLMPRNGSGYVGIGTATPSSKLQVGNQGDGSVAVANSWNSFSDIRLKDNITPLSNSLDKVMALEGVSFNWKASGLPSIGFIAQDVERVIPEIVSTDANGIKSLDYGKIAPLLVNAVHEQQSEIASLSSSINKLQTLNFIPYPASASSDFVTIKDSLLVLGTTTLNNLSVANSISLGSTMQIGGNSINTIGQDFEIQPLKQANISIMGGLVDIDTQGNVNISGNLNVLGSFTAKNAKVDNLSISNHSVTVVSDSEVSANGSSGQITLKANQTEIKIDSGLVNSSSLIFITPTNPTGGKQLYIKQKDNGKSFTVGIENAYSADIQINFLIIN